MTDFLLVTEAQVRDYIDLNASEASSKYSSQTVTSNIRAAAEMLERACGRYFADRPAVSLTVTTENAPVAPLPGLRSVSSVTLGGSALTADETYWLVPDALQTGQYVGVQVRARRSAAGGAWWRAWPDWFDRGLDLHNPAGGGWALGEPSGEPRNLVVAGDGGYTAATLPDSVKLAVKALAAFLTLRPTGALLSGALQTPAGNVFDLSSWPLEVRTFVEQWRLGGYGVTQA